ncbi:MAG: ABC transporter ATP-binding protein [Chloroflexia bacterium]|nr:ABC transporter ATP-binding protein [Chloroflexia bacterium]
MLSTQASAESGRTANASDPLLATDHLSIHYGARSALNDVSLTVHPGTVTSLLGPNGAGKSTLLKAFAGVVPPSHGSISFRGAQLRRPHPDITYIPQRSGAEWTFPISVIEAVLLGLAKRTPRFRGFNSEERRLALDALDHVGMLPLANIQIGALSGGQQQRVFLARALVTCGDVLLLDEPFTGVDVPTQDLFLDLFESLSRRGVTIIFATHDIEHTVRSATRVILINNRIVADGPPANVLSDDILSRTFEGRIMVFDQDHDRPAGPGTQS